MGARPIGDIGCGPGLHLAALPSGSIGVEPAEAMLDLAKDRVPAAGLVRGGAGAIPLRTGSLGGAVLSKVLIHIDRRRLPMALADLHRVLALDAPVELVMFGGDQDLTATAGDDFPGRRFALWGRSALTDILEGAGFEVERFDEHETSHWPRFEIGARRLRSLPDTVGAGYAPSRVRTEPEPPCRRHGRGPRTGRKTGSGRPLWRPGWSASTATRGEPSSTTASA